MAAFLINKHDVRVDSFDKYTGISIGEVTIKFLLAIGALESADCNDTRDKSCLCISCHNFLFDSSTSSISSASVCSMSCTFEKHI